MGILDDIKKSINAGFKGLLLKGELHVLMPTGVVDMHGDPHYTITKHSIEGFVDTNIRRYKMPAGTPDSDVVILIFSESIKPFTKPNKDNRVRFTSGGAAADGTLYQLRDVMQDPAMATFQSSAFVIEDESAP
jgi:hypothetical protein